jgi:dihydroorotase
VPGGSLASGHPGDVTLLDLDREAVIEPEAFESKGRCTPFKGMKLKGRAVATVVAGGVAWRG